MIFEEQFDYKDEEKHSLHLPLLQRTVYGEVSETR